MATRLSRDTKIGGKVVYDELDSLIAALDELTNALSIANSELEALRLRVDALEST